MKNSNLNNSSFGAVSGIVLESLLCGAFLSCAIIGGWLIGLAPFALASYLINGVVNAPVATHDLIAGILGGFLVVLSYRFMFSGYCSRSDGKRTLPQALLVGGGSAMVAIGIALTVIGPIAVTVAAFGLARVFVGMYRESMTLLHA